MKSRLGAASPDHWSEPVREILDGSRALRLQWIVCVPCSYRDSPRGPKPRKVYTPPRSQCRTQLSYANPCPIELTRGVLLPISFGEWLPLPMAGARGAAGEPFLQENSADVRAEAGAKLEPVRSPGITKEGRASAPRGTEGFRGIGGCPSELRRSAILSLALSAEEICGAWVRA